MTKFLGYSVVRNDGSIVVSEVRHSIARRKLEELGGGYRIEECWEGVPISAVAREHTNPRKKR